jgi:hypothetical protein
MTHGPATARTLSDVGRHSGVALSVRAEEVSVLRRMSQMPAGTIGFEAAGKVDDDDFEDVVAPVLRQEIARGATLRLLYLFGPKLHDYEADEFQEEVAFAVRHPTAYERVAVVSDETWLRPALRVLSLLVPGRLRGFPVAELEAAKRWVSAEEHERTGADSTEPPVISAT